MNGNRENVMSEVSKEPPDFKYEKDLSESSWDKEFKDGPFLHTFYTM